MPFNVSRSIKYNYPISDKKLQDSFWRDNFCVAEEDQYLLLIFNSAYTHISAVDASKSKITDDILHKMDQELSKVNSNKCKIALCHHHPISHSNATNPDTDVIDKGERFLELLCKHNFIMIIHGHKHEIKIRYYNDLVVFCAGSFSSLENIRETESDNVFHRIEVSSNKKGIITTWVYGAISGWVQKSGKKFPALCGFGFHGSVTNVAQAVSDWFENSSNQKFDKYHRLVLGVPDLQFLLPDQQRELESILTTQYKIAINYNSHGIPVSISKLIIDE